MTKKSQITLLLSLALSVAACGGKSHKNAKAPSDDFKRERGDRLETVDEGMVYSDAKFSPSTKVFLIAASRRGANFAEEIVAQKKYWLQQGLSEKDIACYYVIPDKDSYYNDLEQYDALKGDLASCYAAKMHLITKHIKSVKHTSSDFVYIYVTSHGADPISYWIEQEEDENHKNYLMGLAKNYPFLNQYFLSLDAFDFGTGDLTNVLDEVDDGSPYEDVMFTTLSFKKALANLPSRLKKYVVLQACHSGGFAYETKSPYKDQTLQDQPNLMLMTAARHDRTSFGCNLDATTTYYGGAFNHVLSKQINLSPSQIDWLAIHKAVSKIIEKKEADIDATPSIPQYFSNL